MAENSNIGWTTHTNNFWWGCHKVSAECKLCYIDRAMARAKVPPFQGPVRTKVGWTRHKTWNKQAGDLKERFRIFTCSMSDFFHPGADAWRPEAWEAIKSTPNLDWLILTKRPELIAERLPPDWGEGYPNVWMGVSVGCNDTLWRIPEIQKIPAKIRFISAEPLLEKVDFRGYTDKIDWIITGCESGAADKRRPMEMSWVEDIDEVCKTNNIAHFFKQYFVGTELRHDGIINGVITQNYPKGA